MSNKKKSPKQTVKSKAVKAKPVSIKKITVKKTAKPASKKVVNPSRPKAKAVVKTSKKTLKPDTKTISKSDEKLLAQTLEMVSSLNHEIAKVHEAKTKLQTQVANLSKKVDAKPKVSKDEILKQELIKEFEPVFQKLNPGKIKSEIGEELNSIFEIEIQKVKSQLNSLTSKNQKETKSKISEIEDKLTSAIKENEIIRKQVAKLNDSKLSEDIFIEIEKKIVHSVNNAIEKLEQQKEAEIVELRQKLESQKKSQQAFKDSYQKFKNEIEIAARDNQIDISAISSKLSNLELENKSLKRLIEKYENELYNRMKTEEFEVEKRVNQILKSAEKTLVDVKKEEEKQAAFLVEKVNEVIDSVNGFEDYFKKVEINSIKAMKKELENSFKNTRKKVLEDLKEKDIQYHNEVLNFKSETSKHIQKIISELNKEFTTLKNAIAEYEQNKAEFLEYTEQDKQIERNFIIDKYHEIYEKATQTEKEVVELIHKNKLALEEKLVENIEVIKVQLKEDFAKLTMSNNEALTRLNTMTKEKHRDLSEEIETKLISSKNQLEEKFKEILDRHELALAQKEKDYIQKLEFVEEERRLVLSDMNRFKNDMAELTKDYVASMDEELKKVKLAEASFDKDKENFLSEIEEILTAKKLELDDVTAIAKSQVSKVLEDEKEAFSMHEETFRDTFNTKVSNLQEYTQKRLDSIEKKFVEKNLKYVTEELDSFIEPIRLIEESIIAKEDMLSKKVDEINMREEALIADLHSHEDALKEKVEERITGLEQNLNKRFLDMDSDFSNFKRIVIDEVEDLMREVDDLVNKKVGDADTMINKLHFAASEITKKIADFDSVHQGMKDEAKTLRDELNDLRVKVEINNSHHGLGTMSRLVSMMSEYEDNLVSLVSSLKNRGVSDREIEKALRGKGHPMMYVEMVLNSLNRMKH